MIVDGDNTGRCSGVVGNTVVEMKNQFVLKSCNPDLLGTLGPRMELKPTNVLVHHVRTLFTDVTRTMNSDS